MSVGELVFYLFAALTLLSAVVVVASSNILRSAFSLLLTLGGMAGLYVVLGQDLLAGLQVLVYVGGVLVIILFAVMMTRRIGEAETSNESVGTFRAAFACAVLFAVLSAGILSVDWGEGAGMMSELEDPVPTTKAVGRAFLGEYLLPFEVVSILLLVALMGAAVIVRKEYDRDDG